MLTSSLVDVVQNWVEGEAEADSDAAAAEIAERRRKERSVNGNHRCRVVCIFVDR